MRYTAAILGTSFVLFSLGQSAQLLDAQITNQIRAHIEHSFIDLTQMKASNQDGTAEVLFAVRESIDDHRPKHSELLFRKYGNTEFLSKIYEVGSKTGVSLTETSKQEEALSKQGQPTEHTEEQK